MHVKLMEYQQDDTDERYTAQGFLASILNMLMNITQQNKIRPSVRMWTLIHHAPELISLTSAPTHGSA